MSAEPTASVSDADHILAEIERGEPLEPCWRIASRLQRLIDEQYEGQPPRGLELDFLLCRLHRRGRVFGAYDEDEAGAAGVPGKKKGAAVDGFNSFGGGWPDPLKLAEEGSSYFEKRADSVGNPVLRGRYHDFLFCIPGKSRDKLAHAGQAVAAYLESARRFTLQHENRTGRHDAHDAAVHLDYAAVVAARAKNAELLKDVVEALEGSIREGARLTSDGRLEDLDQARCTLELSDLLVWVATRPRATVEDASLLQIQVLAERTARGYREQGDHDGAFEFLELAQRVANQRAQPAEALELGARACVALEEQAHTSLAKPSSSHLRAAGLYRLAIYEYEKLLKSAQSVGDANTVRFVEMKLRAVKLDMRNEYLEGEGEVAPVETPAEVRKDLEEYIDWLLQPPTILECLVRIATEEALISDLQGASSLLKEYGNLGFAIAKIPTMVVAEGLPTSSGEGPPAAEVLLKGVLMRETAAVLQQLFDRLRSGKKMTVEDILAHLSTQGTLSEGDRAICGAGLKLYYSRDWVGAAHILAPRLEAMLRGWMLAHGMDVYQRKRRSDDWDFQTLSELLGELETVLNPALVEYARWVLDDRYGLNLRNRIAHGLAQPEECTRSACDLLLHLLLIISSLDRSTCWVKQPTEEHTP
ncbi:MAG TPA: DUF4209 domain-containing protein [Armatimonadota bacterium]|nr:DUF4209 domain-containing protein [Armatimonadota bacterium]